MTCNQITVTTDDSGNAEVFQSLLGFLMTCNVAQGPTA